jgi:regulator of sigma E protease
LDENANPNTEPVNSQPAPTVEPNGEPGLPDHSAEVSALKAWLKQNAVSLLVTAVVITIVCIKLDVIDTVKVVIGLGLVIFIHELGHFLAAKSCDVHVKTFSIGFGPSVPFCSYKWGETTYMVGIIPLGGYVSMVGEGDNAVDDDAEEDPRSFRRKTVGQRMLIISAGVIMNIILGMGCFVAAYLHGVKEEPAIVGSVISGGAAWKAGIRTDDNILKIDDQKNPMFKDLRPIVMSTKKGEKLPLTYQRDGKEIETQVEPLRDEGTLFPTLGIAAESRLTLLSFKKKGIKPTRPGSVASQAVPPFEPGDQIVGMTDPNTPSQVTPIRFARDSESGPDINDYYNRMEKLAGQPVAYQVLRKDAPADAKPIDIVVQPAYRIDLGMRMRMSEVVALREGGPAQKEKSEVIARSEGPPVVSGDRITVVKLPEPDGKETWFTTGKEKDQPNITIRKLDPILLPLEVKKWAERNSTNPALKVKLVVLRTVGHKENQPTELTLDYDYKYQNDRESITLPNSPVPIAGLGLAYWVESVVEEVEKDGPADKAGIMPGDVITAIQFKMLDDDGKPRDPEWEEIKAHQWAYADASYQFALPYEIDLKAKRGKDEVKEFNGIQGREDKNWPIDDRGLRFQLDFRTQKANDIGDALKLGGRRTVRFIQIVYMNLYSIIFGRVSAKTMSGPLTIATASYRLAGEDFWQFLLFLGMISVNLAVVNFLPIPVLDGGHMVFLILEKVLGRPVPERLFAFAMYTGLFLILSLMVFVIYLDVKRLF